MARLIVARQEASLLATHAVLRNTYLLLAAALFCSACTAFISTALHTPPLNFWLALGSCFGLQWLTYRYSESATGLLFFLLFSAVLGVLLAPILTLFVASGMTELIILALAGTAGIFFCCSAYVLTTRRDFSSIGSFLFLGMVVILLATCANVLFSIGIQETVISALLLFCSSGWLLYDTSRIIHEGERNYIRAALHLYVSIYNIFVSLLQILRAFGSKDN